MKVLCGEKEYYEALKAAYQIFGTGDLLKFWFFEKHPYIHKWLHYFQIYEQWFSPYRDKEIVFLEIGVWKGGSLQMWKHYFGKNAKIIGVDIDENCKRLEDDQISIEIGSQEDKNFWHAFKAKYPRVDILLDDGGHTMNQQITTFREMFPHIKDGGLYMCEDCHTSYFDKDKWLGGGLRREGTFIEFMKNIIDEINAFWTGDALPITYNTRNLRGLHFYDSIVVAEKKKIPFDPISFALGEDEQHSVCQVIRQSILEKFLAARNFSGG